MRFVGLLTAALSLSGCASLLVEGGATVAPGSEPVGTTIAHWKMDDCRDANGGKIPASAATIGLVRMIDGKFALTDTESGQDTLVVTNGVDDQGTRTFQVRIKGAATNFLLREYRIPVDGAGSGRFALVTGVQTWNERSPGVFTATYAKATLGCTLSRV